jgi:hypothetical protein
MAQGWISASLQINQKSSISSSTPYAERTALHNGYKIVTIPGFDLFDVLLADNYTSYAREDNEAMIRVIAKGRMPTMKHSDRVHRISIGFLYERLSNYPERDESCEVAYNPSDDLKANMYIKVLLTRQNGSKHRAL